MRRSLLKRLKDPDYAINYLNNSLTDLAPEAFLAALRDLIEAREENMTALAQRTGITRQGLHRSLTKTTNPHLSTIRDLLDSLGLQFMIAKRD